MLCSACQNQPATITIMDVHDRSVTDRQDLCAPCAENLGIVQKPMKLSPEILEELLSTVQVKSKGPGRAPRTGECPGCGLTIQQFKAGGRLGCPRCYDTFREELVPLLQRVHEAASHRGRLPGGAPAQTRIDADTGDGGSGSDAAGGAPAAGAVPDDAAARSELLTALRQKLDDAIRGERYEEAARLRDELRRAEHGELP